jgi:KaiC/GvpD/RAD55 family RecA-like ATPase
MKEKLLRIIKLVLKYEKISEEKKEERKKIQLIQDARNEWKEKEEYFRFVSDSDLVDFAIYDIEASKRKYRYLLKNFKKEEKV